MDVSVTHLNNRLALQTPAELPLGLVFVVGRVAGVSGEANGRSSPAQFTLIEQDYRVRCVLSARATAEVALHEGDTVRAGGHLAFDPRRADYYLRVRDVEIIPPIPEQATPPHLAEREALAAVLADIKKRSAAANLANSEMPSWVRRIAPPEIQEPIMEEEETAVSPPLITTDTLPPFSDTLLDRLSAAMDSDEDVELTPDLLADLAPALLKAASQSAPVAPRSEVWQEEVAAGQPVVGYEDPDAYLPRPAQDDGMVKVLLLIFLILSIVIVVAIVMML
jgi:hypothetical protein